MLYERHQRKILSFCKHQLGSREEAEDATQITFLNAFRGMKRGTSPEFESAWLFKIAHNVCLTKQRNSYRRGQIEAPSDFTLIEERIPAHESDSDELFGLTTALRAIPEQQRRALLLREWQGLTYKEIADEMRLTQAAVETMLFRARRSLADALTKDPAEKRKRGRPRTTSNIGSGIAAIKSLLIGGSVKVAATVATVAATSVASVTPVVRNDVMAAVGDTHASKPVAAPKAAPRLHVLASITPLSHPARSPVPVARHVTMEASRGTPVAKRPTPTPTIAAEAQPAAPAAQPAAAPTTGTTPQSGVQLPSVPIPVPASAPAPVSRDAPPVDPDPAPAPVPAVSANTPSAAPAQQSTPSPTPVPGTATFTTTANGPTAFAPPAATQTTTTQSVNAPVVTTPTVTATTQPAPVQTTTTQTQTTTTAVATPPPPAPVDDTPTLNGPPPPGIIPPLGRGINSGWTT